MNAPELFDLAQKPWEEMIHNNMTTTLERYESAEKPTRSEVHPWSASPAYFYFNYLAGIESTKNNFEEVRIAPAFGILNDIEGLYPTGKGSIVFRLQRTGNKLVAEITLPSEMTGELVWMNRTILLEGGKHQYEI